MVRKLGTNKTQVIHCIRLRLFTPRQTSPDVQTTSQQWEPDPEAIIKHDDLYAKAWEFELETPISHKDRDEPDNHHPPAIAMRHDLAYEETSTITGTT